MLMHQIDDVNVSQIGRRTKMVAQHSKRAIEVNTSAIRRNRQRTGLGAN